jgi:hypothetical protein
MDEDDLDHCMSVLVGGVSMRSDLRKLILSVSDNDAQNVLDALQKVVLVLVECPCGSLMSMSHSGSNILATTLSARMVFMC